MKFLSILLLSLLFPIVCVADHDVLAMLLTPEELELAMQENEPRDNLNNTTTYFDLENCFDRMRFLGVNLRTQDRIEKTSATSTHCRKMIDLNNSLAVHLAGLGLVSGVEQQLKSKSRESVVINAQSYFDLGRCLIRARYFAVKRSRLSSGKPVRKVSKRCRGMIESDSSLMRTLIASGIPLVYRERLNDRPKKEKKEQ